MPLRLLLLLLLPLALLAPRAGWADELPRPGGNAATLLSGPAVEPEFLPVEQAYPLRAELLDARLRFTWDILPGYYLYRSRMGLANATSGAREPVPVDWPAGIPHEDEFFGATEIYREHLVVEIPLPASGAQDLLLSSQGCADAGLCYPPRTQRFRVDPVAGTVSELAPEEQAAPRAPASAPVLAGTGQSLPLMALFAFLGGLILNLMPCVFPVLSLKVLGIAQKGGGQGTALGHGLAYSAGVVLSFLAVAALLIGLRGAGAAIGWGFHLQSPVFVASLAYLFVTMGLGLSGVANLGAGLMGVGSSIAARAGLAGSFFTGVLAAVVASPCSAPFMGTALGFAMTQSAAVALGIFAALGL
ncbi:MAG: protein-disulfide reductase DsbD domain-containing protein, partial [Gammaproteobacteria bacterium]